MLSKTHAKYIQSLHHKKFRDAEGAFIAEGNKVVSELLQSGKFKCKELLALPEWIDENETHVKNLYKEAVIPVTKMEMDKISALSTPGNVLAVFYRADEMLPDLKDKITLMLDTIQDPGNFGTIIRIADWFGVSNIICSNDTVEMYNPKVVQSTMGSLARINIIYTDLLQFIQQNKRIKIFAATLNGKTIAEIKPLKEAIIIIGNESKGISKELLDLATEKITIPKKGTAESLNAAVATGIILSHLI